MFSKHGTTVSICIFDDQGEHRHVLKHRDGDVHYGSIKGLKVGTRYGFRVDGPWAPELGLRFDSSKLLVDPFAWALDGAFIYHHNLTLRGLDTAALVPKCVVQNPLPDVVQLPKHKPEFIYELPVKAYTQRHEGVPEAKRGTVAALAEPIIISHLKNIGIDTVELMPITAWIDERHLQPLGLNNAWGYNPVQFFAPDPKIAPGGLEEIRDTIATLHQNNIRVILDIVLNHTGESDQFGPTICLRGFDSPLYYAHARGELINDAGCGNTVALNDPHVVEMVIAALRHWVLKAGVDGFRFDLATVMGRLPNGFSATAPLFQAIENDPVLMNCILIAEPWDIGPGGYQLGQFPKKWQEWNDKFRDDVRKFWRGDPSSANQLATRITGSSDVFWQHGQPSYSINFLSAHDGFTLHDVVRYRVKDNFNNGEENRDGKSGEATSVGGNVKALLATLFLSRGTVMLTAGDEFGRTQLGNNNAYAQDNDVTWLDWKNRDEDLIAYVASLMNLRRDQRLITEDQFLNGNIDPKTGLVDATWVSATGGAVDWNNANLRFVGLLLANLAGRIAIAFNGSADPVAWTLSAKPKFKWQPVYSPTASAVIEPRSVQIFQEVLK